MAARTTRTNRILVEVSEEARERFKMVAARRRMTMRALLEEMAQRAERETFGEILAKGSAATIEEIRSVDPEAAEIVAAGREALEDARAGRLLTWEEVEANMEAVLAEAKARRNRQGTPAAKKSIGADEPMRHAA